MDKSSLENLLNIYDPATFDGDGTSRQWSDLAPEERAELESLARLNALLKQTLVQMPARVAFREDLRQSLLTTAMERQGWRGLLVLQLREHWKLTAATASGVSVAVGALSVVAWYRSRSQP